MSAVQINQVIFAKSAVEYPIPGETMKYQAGVETIDLDTAHLDGGILIKTLYLSVDPYMRGRLRDANISSYSAPFELGKPLIGRGIAVVVRSDNSKFAAGDYVWSMLSWRNYNIITENQLQASAATVIQNPTNLPLSLFLGIAGSPAATAWYSLDAFSKWKKGETIYVSTAAGAVGMVVVQLAKLAGLKVIGSAGADDKVEFLNSELGVDVAFNYKTSSVWDVLKENGPIDIYYDNVGGETLDAAILNMRDFGRIIFCGYASEYNIGNNERYGVKNMHLGLAKSLTFNGFNIATFIREDGFKRFRTEYLPLVREGKIKSLEHKTYGLEKIDQALVDVLRGKNKGKAIVVVDEEFDRKQSSK